MTARLSQSLDRYCVGTFIDQMVVHEGTGKLYAISRTQDKVGVVNAATGAFIHYMAGDYSLTNFSGFNSELDESWAKCSAVIRRVRQIDVLSDVETMVPGFGGGGEEKHGRQPDHYELFVSRVGADTWSLSMA